MTSIMEPQAPQKPELDEETRNVLRTAKEIISRGWYALKPDRSSEDVLSGNMYSCRTGEEPACLLDSLNRQEHTQAVEKARLVLQFLTGTPHLHRWNDAPGRTQEEVIALLDKALVD